MKVTLIIWISAIILKEVEPGTIVRIPRDVANLKSSIHTEYEANYKQKGKHGNDSFSTIKGNQEILHENCNDTWNEFAEKCASLVKDLIASLANTISSSPGDATNLQLHIKNNFTHIDTSHKRNCFNRPPTCLSKLNFSSLFNNETGNVLNKPNADAPLSVLTTLKKPDSFEQDSPNSIQPNEEDVILNNSAEDPKTSQQGSSLDYGNGSHMNPEEAEALTGPQINNSRRQVKHPASQEEESGNAMVTPGDSTTDPSANSRLLVIPLNTNDEARVSFDPKDMSLEISAVPSDPPFNVRSTSPNPYFADRMGNSDNSFLDQSTSNENLSSGGSKTLGIADTSSEGSNEFLSNLLDGKNSISPKYTSQQVSSEEDKYHTYLPPQSLVGEPLLGDTEQLHEEFESEEKPSHKVRGHAHHEEHHNHHDHHPLHPKLVNEEPPVAVIPQDPYITPATPSPLLLDTTLPSTLLSEDSQSKEPSPPLLSSDHTPDLSKTNESPHSISHQDSLQEPISNPLHPVESQPVIIDNPTPPILAPLSEPEKTPPEILPSHISNVEPPAKEVSHDDISNGNQPPSPPELVPSSEPAQPQILSLPQPSNKPLEASNHLSQKIIEPAELAEDSVSSEENPNNGSSEKSPDDKSSTTALLLIPVPEKKEPKSHPHKHSSPEEHLEIVPPHDPHKIHEHPHPHHKHPHHHPDGTTAVDKDDDEKSLPEIALIPTVDSEEKLSSPKRELTHPHPHPHPHPHLHSHPSHPEIEVDPDPPEEEELPPLSSSHPHSHPHPHPHPHLHPHLHPHPSHPKIELVPVPPLETESPPNSQSKVELVPVSSAEEEQPPPKIELVPVPSPGKELPPPSPPPLPPKVEIVPVPPLENKQPPPPPKIELVPVPQPEDKLPPRKIELVPVPSTEKEVHPLPPSSSPKVELVSVPVAKKETPPSPSLPPPKIELVPVPPSEDKLSPTKIDLVPVPASEKELPPPPKVELVPFSQPEDKLPPPKIALVPVPSPEKEQPPPTKIELVPVPASEKELPPPPPSSPSKVELVPVPVPVPKKEIPSSPPLPPPKIELVPVPPSEDKLSPTKIDLVPVPASEKELPPPPKVELVPVPLPEKELPPPPHSPPSKVELVPVPSPEKEHPPPPKIELVPVSPPENELPPLPPTKIKLIPLVPISSSEKNDIPSQESTDDETLADMPWSSRPNHHHHHHPHHHHPHHPHHHHHHHHHKKDKDDDDDDSSLSSAELRALEEEKQLESEKATTFQTTSADPTPPESALSYPPFYMPNPTSQAPPPLTLPNSESHSMIPSTTTFETVPETKTEYKEENEEDEEADCCSCESCTENDETGGKIHRSSACQDLEQARRELKAIFDKIKKKLKCGRKTQRPTIT